MCRTLCLSLAALAAILGLPAGDPAGAVTIGAGDLDYGISDKQNNNFFGDFSGSPVWTAGSQRSENGSADANNRRAGRVFVDFQLTADIIAAANTPTAPVFFTFTIDSIGQGVSGTPYTDGLDLRFLNVSGSDRNASTLWGTAGLGADQADILATSGSPGTYTVAITNASVKSTIAAASAGQYVSFGMSNSTGVDLGAPVGNSTAETYGFQTDTSTTGYALEVIATQVVAPTGITQTQGDTLAGWSPDNLVDGSGLSAPVDISNISTVTHTLSPATGWVTGTGTFPTNYFDAGGVAPQFVVDLSEIRSLTALTVWGYGGNNNEASDFFVEFSTDGGTTWSTSTETVATSALLGDNNEILAFSDIHLADAVRLTITENAGGRGFGGTGPGDRVGFGELTLLALVPEPSTGTLLLFGLAALATRRRHRRSH